MKKNDGKKLVESKSYFYTPYIGFIIEYDYDLVECEVRLSKMEKGDKSLNRGYSKMANKTIFHGRGNNHNFQFYGEINNYKHLRTLKQIYIRKTLRNKMLIR